MITGVSTARSAGVASSRSEAACADVDHRRVVGPLLAAHDLAVGELASDLLHHHGRGSAHGSESRTRRRGTRSNRRLSRPMKTFGSATLITVCALVKRALPLMFSRPGSSFLMVSMYDETARRPR